MLENDESIDKALSDYMTGRRSKIGMIDPYVSTLEKLEMLRNVPERDSEAQAKGRRAFLQQAKSITVPVSEVSKLRHKRWNIFQRKERSLMSTLASVLFALIVAFSGVGSTAYVAQASLPTDPLYPVKQLTEDVRLALTTDPETEVDFLLTLAEERVNEMMALADKGLQIPEETPLRLEHHLQLALSETAQLGDPALMVALQRLRNMAQVQIQAMQRLQQKAPAEACQGLEDAIRAMNRAQNEAEDGLADPMNFRLRHGKNRPEDAPQQPENIPPKKKGTSPRPADEGLSGRGFGDGTGSGGGAYGNGNGDGTGDGGGAYGNGYGDGTGDGGGAYGDGYGDGSCEGGGAYGNGNGDGTPCECPNRPPDGAP